MRATFVDVFSEAVEGGQATTQNLTSLDGEGRKVTSKYDVPAADVKSVESWREAAAHGVTISSKVQVGPDVVKLSVKKATGAEAMSAMARLLGLASKPAGKPQEMTPEEKNAALRGTLPSTLNGTHAS